MKKEKRRTLFDPCNLLFGKRLRVIFSCAKFEWEAKQKIPSRQRLRHWTLANPVKPTPSGECCSLFLLFVAFGTSSASTRRCSGVLANSSDSKPKFLRLTFRPRRPFCESSNERQQRFSLCWRKALVTFFYSFVFSVPKLYDKHWEWWSFLRFWKHLDTIAKEREIPSSQVPYTFSLLRGLYLEKKDSSTWFLSLLNTPFAPRPTFFHSYAFVNRCIQDIVNPLNPYFSAIPSQLPETPAAMTLSQLWNTSCIQAAQQCFCAVNAQRLCGRLWAPL